MESQQYLNQPMNQDIHQHYLQFAEHHFNQQNYDDQQFPGEERDLFSMMMEAQQKIETPQAPIVINNEDNHMMMMMGPPPKRNAGQLKYGFQCICGSEIKQIEELIKHKGECEMVSVCYDELFSTVNRFINQSGQQNADSQSIMNLYSILQIIQKQIRAQLKGENLQPQNLDHHLEQPEPEDTSSSQKLNGHPPLMKEDSWQQEYQLYIQMQQYQKCSGCKEIITPKDEALQAYTILQCMHMIHKECLKNIATLCVKGHGQNCCPECNERVSQVELKEILGPQFLELLDKLAESLLLSQNQNLVTCSCQNIMEVVPGQVDYNIKDDVGQPISREAAVHMSQFRIRCQKCEKNFCCKCQAEPYHIGKTCEQFKEHKEASKCRYCFSKIEGAPPSVKPAFRNVCRQQACVELMNKSCDKVLQCGHPCCGFSGEKKCLPCLEESCVEKNQDLTMGAKADDYCSICYTDGLGQGPCVKLDCNHIFHLDCIMSKIKTKWLGARIFFSYMDCPSCKREIKASHCPEIENELKDSRILKEAVVKKALERAKIEGLEKEERLKNPDDVYFNDLQGYALSRLSFYNCFSCQQPYFGGMRECGQQDNAEAFKKEDLVCGACVAKKAGVGVNNCPTHGTDAIEFKCRYCCSVALWFCFGTTHFCEPCHQKAGSNKAVACPGKDKCPLGIEHPANGNEYALGCGLCRHNAIEPIGKAKPKPQPPNKPNVVRGGGFLFGRKK